MQQWVGLAGLRCVVGKMGPPGYRDRALLRATGRGQDVGMSLARAQESPDRARWRYCVRQGALDLWGIGLSHATDRRCLLGNMSRRAAAIISLAFREAKSLQVWPCVFAIFWLSLFCASVFR